MLLGVYRQMWAHPQLGIGFSDFADDLTRLGNENRGWFFNVVGKY